MGNEKIGQFLETLVEHYKDRRTSFHGSHWLQVSWYLKRIRPSREHRENEYKRILNEEIGFVIDEDGEIKSLSRLAAVDRTTLLKSKYILKSHILRLKYRSDYLALVLGLFGLLMTGGLTIQRLDSSFSLWTLLPLIIAGILVIVERHLFIDKVCMYDEICNLIEYQLES